MVRMLGCAASHVATDSAARVGKHIHDPSPLQVDEDRPEMLLALLPGPIIDAHDLQDAPAPLGTAAAPLQQAQNGVVADRHPQPMEQALTTAVRPGHARPDARPCDTDRCGGPAPPRRPPTGPRKSPKRSARFGSASA